MVRCEYSRLSELELTELDEHENSWASNGYDDSPECEDEDRPNFSLRTILCKSPTGVDLEEREAELADEMFHLQSQLEACSGSLEARRKRLDEMNSHWATKRAKLENEIQEIVLEKERLEYNIDKLKFEDKEIPPGPAWLQFVEGNIFTAVASTVIIANLTTMTIEMLYPHYAKDFFLLDQAFLVFYTVELAMKAVLFRDQLLNGPVKKVWWNWLDLVIVVSGILDDWLRPLLGGERLTICGFPLSGALRFLRLARLARILKIVRVLFYADFSWADGARFQLFIMSVIGLSCIMMGLELDFPDFVLWPYLEQMVLIIFVFELVVRLRLQGMRFFCGPDTSWNALDAVIVISGIIDLWIIPMYFFFAVGEGTDDKESRKHANNLAQHMKLLRMLRLLRILRLIRLIKNIPQLFTLLMGITQAMAGMMWVLLLTVMVLYAFALVAVKLLRDGLAYGAEEAPEEVVETFKTIWDSIFVLFLVMNGNVGIIRPVFETLPFSKVVYMMFTVTSSWAILSILTAVVSDKMIEATEDHKQGTVQEQTQEHLDATRKVFNEIFDSIDASGDGTISKEEFESMLDDDDQRESLLEATGMTLEDLKQFYNLLERKDEVHRDIFIEGLERESKDVNERSIMRLEKRITSVEDTVTELRDLMKDSKEYMQLVATSLMQQGHPAPLGGASPGLMPGPIGLSGTGPGSWTAR